MLHPSATAPRVKPIVRQIIVDGGTRVLLTVLSLIREVTEMVARGIGSARMAAMSASVARRRFFQILNSVSFTLPM